MCGPAAPSAQLAQAASSRSADAVKTVPTLVGQDSGAGGFVWPAQQVVHRPAGLSAGPLSAGFQILVFGARLSINTGCIQTHECTVCRRK